MHTEDCTISELALKKWGHPLTLRKACCLLLATEPAGVLAFILKYQMQVYWHRTSTAVAFSLLNFRIWRKLIWSRRISFHATMPFSLINYCEHHYQFWPDFNHYMAVICTWFYVNCNQIQRKNWKLNYDFHGLRGLLKNVELYCWSMQAAGALQHFLHR